jgi:large subunit ribosomal protein L17
MRHRKNTKKFKRTEEERRRLKIDLSRGLIKNGQIVTFTARGKWFRSFFERLVTLCKRAGDDTHLAYRRLRVYLDEETSRIMLEKIVPKMKNRNGGYTQQYKLSQDFSNHDKSVIRITDYTI